MNPSSLIDVVKVATSNPFKAVLTSPFEIFASFLKVSSSILMLYSPNPSFLSIAFFSIWYIFSSVNGSSLITIDLEINALFTSKYGFSVVAPIKITVPFSTYGNNASCCNLLNLCISSINNILFPIGFNMKFFVSSITFFISATPAVTALIL